MPKEILPITPPLENLWWSVMTALAENPDSIVPVILQDPITKKNGGRFYASVVKEGERGYLQVENATDEIAELLSGKGREFGWQAFIGGVYRLPLTSPLLSPQSGW